LQLSLTGGSKDMADTIAVTVSSDTGVTFTSFSADRSNVQANADNVSFLDTRVGSWANFRNNHYQVAANNLERRLIPSDLQIMPENNVFYLTMFADRQFRTNALVINYSPDFIVNGASNDNSLIRQADKLNAQSSNGSDSIESPDQIGQFTSPRFSDSAGGSQLLLPGLVTGFSNGLGSAVNLGNTDNTSSPGTGETREEEKDNQ
jgi:hypothetical protein